MWLIGQALINGLLSGGVYALVAVGLTIVFGVMKIVNFAMGEYLMLGMYATYIGFMLTGLNAYWLIPFVIVIMAIIGIISFKLTIRPLLSKKSETAYILVTVGLSFFLLNMVELIFGPNYLTVPSNIKSASFALGNFTIGYPRLIALLVALILVVLVNLMLNKTLLGRAMRATSEKPEVAQLMGINTERTYMTAFTLSIVIAGIAGLLLTALYYAYPQMGAMYGTATFVAVVLGGMGNIKGAFIGGLLIGLVENLVGTTLGPDLGPAGIFLMFIVVVYFRPQGLFGKKERVG